MLFQINTSVPYSQLETVGIAVMWIPDFDQVHMGILIRLGEDDIQLCHLRFHYDLKLEVPDDGYYWDRCSMFVGNKERLASGRVFSAWVLAVSENPEIPYGFEFDLHCFNDDGSYEPMAPGKGLTCATFIVATFHSAGFAIIKPDTWRARSDDAAWQQKILEPLKRHATPEHVVAAESFIGRARYRPEEIAAAAICAPPSLTLEDCIPLAEQILQTIGTK